MRAKQIRELTGRSRMWVAVKAGVSEPTARLYEVDPAAIESEQKRAALAAVYAELAAEATAPGLADD